MVVPAFGFSVGDFVAVIEIISKTVKALRENSGDTATKYQLTILDLTTVENVLKRTQRLRPNDGTEEIIQQIQLYGQLCHGPLAKFIERLRKHEMLFYPSSKGPMLATLSRSRKKIQWTMFVSEEVTRLKTAIAPQLVVISILLQFAVEETGSRTLNLVTDVLRNVQSIEKMLSTSVATKDQVEGLATAVHDMSLYQRSQGTETLGVVRTSQAAINEVESELARQEQLLQSLIRQERQQATILGETAPSLREDVRERSITRVDSGLATLEVEVEDEKVKEPDDGGSRLSWTLHTMRKVISELFMALLCLIPAMQGMLRASKTLLLPPTMLLEDNIHVIDALGRTLSLPYSHFKFWPVLHARLKCDFRDLPGSLKVKEGEFGLVDLRGRGQLSGRLITEKNWEKAVFPGSKLAMSIYYDFRVAKSWCPKCSAAAPSGFAKFWINW